MRIRAAQSILSNLSRRVTAHTSRAPASSSLQTSINPIFQQRRPTMSTAPHPVSSSADGAKPAASLHSIVPPEAGSSSAPKPMANGHPKPAKTKEKKDKKGGEGGSSLKELSPPPEFFSERIKIFDEYKAKYNARVAGMWILTNGQSR